MRRLAIPAILVSFPLLLFTSCSSNPEIRQGQTTGAVIGGLAGGLITDSWGGAAVGAAMGGLVGGEVAKNR
jgi:hypothetical protein